MDLSMVTPPEIVGDPIASLHPISDLLVVSSPLGQANRID